MDRAALARLVPWPSIVLTDQGHRGVWPVASRVTIRWRQRRLAGAAVAVELSRDHGRSWRTLGLAPAERESFDWVAEPNTGRALIRVRTGDGRFVSNVRRVLVVPRVREIASGWGFVLAVMEDGTARGWGRFQGDGCPAWTEPAELITPTVIPGMTGIRSAAAGGYHAVLIKEDGSAWVWGNPSYEHECVAVKEPKRIDGVENAVFARASGDRSFVAVSDGRVFGVSGNGRSVWQDGEEVPADVPIELPELKGVVDIQLGAIHGLALRADGTVLSFGSNSGGMLGDPSAEGRSRPGPVPGLDNVVGIAASGGDQSMALRRDGRVFVWGATGGLTTTPGHGYASFVPYMVPGLDHVTAIGSGFAAGYALRDDGQMFAWGLNDYGEVGDGTTIDRHVATACIVRDVIRFFVTDVSVHTFDSSGRHMAWGSAGSVFRPSRSHFTPRPLDVFIR